MLFFNWLLQRTPGVADDAPQIIRSGSPVQTSPGDFLERLDAADTDATAPMPAEEAAVFGKLELENIFCILEYVDSKGNETRRRVTMLSLQQGPYAPVIHAICHERKAFRHFRVDRIESIISPDGEVLDPAEFFRDTYGISLADLSNSRVAGVQTGIAGSIVAARQFRDQLRAPLSVLVCASMVDGQVHPEETDRIQGYAETEILALHRAGKITTVPSTEILDELGKLIRVMRPQKSSLPNYIATICEWPEERVLRLARYLGNVIAADGKILDEEILFVEEMNEFARAGWKERFGYLSAIDAKLFDLG